LALRATFKRDVILGDKINHAQGLLSDVQGQLNGLSYRSNDDLLKQAVQGLVNYWQSAINNYKKEQEDITNQYGQ